jgi:ATP-binding cassette subfamily B protein/ATP-binding cassette subfamily B protein RtxE
LGIGVLPGISNQPLDFLPDQSVAIIGPSGSGKTTLLETLAGTLKARRKLVVLDGKPLEPCDIQDYLARVRYCPQQPIFLEGLFGQSVLFGQALSPGLIQVIDAFGLRALAGTRYLSEGCKNISGGEAKRLSLLRLINRPGDFNLFDEPTGALDPETALQVWDTILTIFHKRGLICTTHDLSALSRFDRVIVIRGGVVIADGPWGEISYDTMVKHVLGQLGEAGGTD